MQKRSERENREKRRKKKRREREKEKREVGKDYGASTAMTERAVIAVPI